MTVIERPDWECGCPNDHRMTRTRAWCGACSEWCYEEALCVRGEAEQLRAENEKLVTLLRGIIHEVGDIMDAKS